LKRVNQKPPAGFGSMGNYALCHLSPSLAADAPLGNEFITLLKDTSLVAVLVLKSYSKGTVDCGKQLSLL